MLFIVNETADYELRYICKRPAEWFVFKCKKERDNLNPQGRDSLNHYFNLVLTIANSRKQTARKKRNLVMKTEQTIVVNKW